MLLTKSSIECRGTELQKTDEELVIRAWAKSLQFGLSCIKISSSI